MVSKTGYRKYDKWHTITRFRLTSSRKIARSNMLRSQMFVGSDVMTGFTIYPLHHYLRNPMQLQLKNRQWHGVVTMSTSYYPCRNSSNNLEIWSGNLAFDKMKMLV